VWFGGGNSLPLSSNHATDAHSCRSARDWRADRKEITTPEYYPLSLNALTNACNQKSNREPVMQLEEHEIRKALNHLESQSLVRSIAESRATKFAHRMQDAFNFYRPEVAIVCELLLRGPQTPGELRTRSSRMHPLRTWRVYIRRCSG
jgi:uncharacterized protein YceH (UPF0502 family)